VAEKKYYWLKLERNFFKRHDIRIIEDMPNGKEYVLFFMKLLVESIDHEGELRFNSLIPYNDQMLATITNTNIDIVRSAISMFQSLRLLEIWDDKTIYISDTTKMLGEGKSTDRVRRYRHNKQLEIANETQGNVTETLHETEIEKEKELDIEIEKDNTVAKTTRFVKPTSTDIESYAKENNLKIDANYFIDYYEANGWKVGRNAMKDWKATVRRWCKNQFTSGKTRRTEPEVEIYVEQESDMSQAEKDEIKNMFKNMAKGT